MKIPRLSVDEQGETHFGEMEIALENLSEVGAISNRIPVTGLYFRKTLPSYSLDWHNAPRRQYIVNLDAAVEITASDGETRVIGTGEVFFVEDTTGKGHLSKAVDDKLRHSLFIAVD